MAYVAPSTRTTGTLITAAIWNQDVVANAIAIYAGAMGIASQAALDFVYASSATQLARLAKGSGGQVVRLNAAASAYEFASNVPVLNRAMTQVDVSNSNTETTVYSYAVAGGTIGTTGALRLSLWGFYVNNTVGTPDLTVRAKFGGTTIAGDTAFAALGASGNSRRFFMEVLIANGNSAAVQRINAVQRLGATEADAGGTMATPAFHRVGGYNGLTKDTASSQTLLVSAQHNTVDANIIFRMDAAVLELL